MDNIDRLILGASKKGAPPRKEEEFDEIDKLIMGATKPPAQPETTPQVAPQVAAEVAPQRIPQQIEVPQIGPTGQVVRDVAQPRQVRGIKDYLLGGGEALLSIATGGVMAPIAAGEQLATDIGTKLAGGKPTGQEVFAKRMEAGTFQPRTETGKEILQTAGEVFEATKLPPVLTPELMALSSIGRMPKGEAAPAPRIEPGIGVKTKGMQPAVQSVTMPAPTASQPFPEVKYAAKGRVNLPEQEARKQILGRVGLERARESSILGDGFAAANEFQTSKVDAPVGQLYRDTLASERATLENFGQKIVERTGGTLGLDEQALYDRGARIARPFDDFKSALQNQMNDAYTQAKQIAGTQPAVSPSNLQKFLDTDSNFTVNDSFMSLRRGIQAHLRENDLLDSAGRVKPMTVEQAENLRKYVNSNWNNERSGIIGRLKDKIDNDVTKVAGEDVYKRARDIRTKIARLLDDPKGVSKIMDYDPQSPMNRAVPFEKIASTVERMDFDQQAHLIKLLREMPDEVRPQADAAIAEIRAQFANRILQEGSKNKGQWNASNVTKYLNDNNRRLEILMEDPQLAQMVKDLHDAGHLLKYDPSYPGAAIQAHNLVKLGAAPLLGTLGGAAGTAIGASMFGPGGAALGGTTGATLGAQRGVKMAEKSALKRAEKKMVPLKDIAKEPMRIDIRGVGQSSEKD